MESTIYQLAKSKLRAHAEYTKVLLQNDNPAIRQSINDYTYDVCSDFNLSEYQQNLLHNYACALHPKTK